MAAHSGVNPEAFGKAGIKAYLAAAAAALAGDDPDVEEAIAQIAAARLVIGMFENDIREREAADVANDLHDGVAFINGRLFEVDHFLPETREVRTGPLMVAQVIERATIKIKWR